MYRKIAIISISVFMERYGIITQALLVFFLLISFLFVNLKLHPFSLKVLNDMENLSLVTSMITIYCGIFYLSDSSSSEMDQSCVNQDGK